MVGPALAKWQGRRVFITGHTGFKGSWLAFLLRNAGAEVMGYALPPVGDQSHFNMLGLEKMIEHVEGDVRDGTKLAARMSQFNPEFVFHLAAQALVRKSYLEPKLTFDTNVGGSINLLEAVRQCSSVRALIYVTSDKCYENVEWVWGYRENDRLGGHDPYSASKAAAELAFSAYARSYFAARPGFGAATVRAGNVIGGGDWAEDRIIPDCIRAIRANEPIILRNPGATRPWQHVLEPLSGYIALAEKLCNEPSTYNGSWNFGPVASNVRTVQQVTNVVVARLGRGEVQVNTSTSSGLPEASLLQLNCDKAHQILRWHPKWDVDYSIRVTADWYKEVLSGEPAVVVTRRQIQNYFEEPND